MLSTGRELHVDQHLTELAINYRPQNFIADQIAPIVTVDKQTNTYPVFSRFEHFAVEDATRAPGTEAKKITRSVGSAAYQVKNYALGSDIVIEDLANMDQAYRFELAEGRARYVLNKLNVGYEKRVVTLAANSTSVNTTFAPTSAWGGTAAGAGDPISHIFTMKEFMQGLVGVAPNRMLIGWRAHQRLLRNYHARNFFRGVNNGGGAITRDLIAGAFELDSYIVSETLWHNQNEAQVTANATSMQLTNPLADQAILYFAPPGASREDPSWMYAFRWLNPQLPSPLTVFRHPYDSRKQVETIEAGYYQDERVTGSDYAVGLLTGNTGGSLV